MIKILDILVVDDDEEDFEIVSDIFSDIRSFKTRLSYAQDYRKALNLINNNTYDVYLIDYRLGIYDGLEITGKIIEKGIFQPIILLTGQSDPKVDEEAARIGASDYLVKGQFNADILERSIRYGLQQSEHLRNIHNLNENLERRVEERTHELIETNQQLKGEIEERKRIEERLRNSETRVKKALEKEKEVGEMKSRFMTMASHEFRTPLSAILSSASLLAKYKSGEQQEKREKHIGRIKGAVLHLNGILEDFLSMAKIEEGKAKNKPLKVNIHDLFQSILDEMQPLKNDQQKLVLECVNINEDHETMIDPNLTRTIFTNLISNSLKYSPPEGVVKMAAEMNGDAVVVQVIDQGIGIPESEQKNIFERFYRASNAANIKGTGIGLNIVFRCVELIGGKIDFASEEQKGSTFTVTLPIS